jgi:hypothetical protein
MLTKAQERLEGHFRGLAHERRSHGYPVYAFEHGLELAEVEAIRDALCAELLRVRFLRKEHWLLWTVVAAEIGYTYDGEEYWFSFASEIRDWTKYGDRNTIRNWFKDFSTRFAGFTPSGRWADQFSIISWPITHSILPRYLQSHFARHLYEIRHDLAANDDTSTDRLGLLLNQRYSGASSRFENFLQQTALTARLVLALRDEDVQGTVTPIFRPTLARIVADLERKGTSRGYLNDARRILRDARVRAQSGQWGPQRGQTAEPALAIRNAARGLKLIARRSGGASWTIGVAFPDFKSLLEQVGIAESLLDKTRMCFSDSAESWMPGRALLSYSGRDHPLKSFPAPLTESLIKFEDGSAASSVPKELTISSQSPWLLRVHEDGAARQVLGNHVRTQEKYLIATLAPIAPDISAVLHLEQADSKTSGLILYLMEVPSTTTPQFLHALSKLEFGYALRAQVEPVGLVPRWDASLGSSVWLPTEEIILRLSADFQVLEFSLSLNGQGKTRFPVQNRREIIVSLGTPPIGRHVVEIGATAAGSQGSKVVRPVSPETIFFEVRPPVPWQQGIQRQAGLRVVLEPSDASLGDLVRKKASISVHGPSNRIATIEARLFDMSGYLAASAEIGRVELPTSDSSLSRAIDKLATDPLSENIQAAPRIDLAFLVEELGAATISFPNKVLPLRWKLTPSGGDQSMRLIDEIGAGAQVLVNRYDMTAPDKRIELDTQKCLAGIVIGAPGALFVARYEGRMYAAIASVMPREIRDFSALGFESVFATPSDSPRRITQLLAVWRRWRVGRPIGPFATLRKANILAIVEHQIERLACGVRWADLARRYRSRSIAKIEDLQGDVGGSPGFAARIRTAASTWQIDAGRARSEFNDFAYTYQVSQDARLCDLALRLAFYPNTISLKDPKKVTDAFDQLGANSVLARGAFFARLTSEIRFQAPEPSVGAHR